MQSYSYTASDNVSVENVVGLVDADIDRDIGGRISTKIEGVCITYTFNDKLSDDNVRILNQLFQTRFVNTSKPRVNSFTNYPRLDSVDSTEFVLIGRMLYRMLTPEQTLDYIDVMAKSDSSYTIKIVDTNGTIVAEKNNNNSEFEMIDMGVITGPTTNILEIYAKVDSGTVYIDQLQFYYSST